MNIQSDICVFVTRGRETISGTLKKVPLQSNQFSLRSSPSLHPKCQEWHLAQKWPSECLLNGSLSDSDSDKRTCDLCSMTAHIRECAEEGHLRLGVCCGSPARGPHTSAPSTPTWEEWMFSPGSLFPGPCSYILTHVFVIGHSS